MRVQTAVFMIILLVFIHDLFAFNDGNLLHYFTGIDEDGIRAGLFELIDPGFFKFNTDQEIDTGIAQCFHLRWLGFISVRAFTGTHHHIDLCQIPRDPFHKIFLRQNTNGDVQFLSRNGWCRKACAE